MHAVRTSTRTLTWIQVMERIVGAPNTPVVLALRRAETQETVRVFLTRGQADAGHIGRLRNKGRASLASLPSHSQGWKAADLNGPASMGQSLYGSMFERRGGAGLKAARAHAGQFVDDLFASTRALVRSLDARMILGSGVSSETPMQQTLSDGSQQSPADAAVRHVSQQQMQGKSERANFDLYVRVCCCVCLCLSISLCRCWAT